MSITMTYKWMTKCPINNIPDKELFGRLNERGAIPELTRRGYDMKSIMLQSKTADREG